MKKTRYITISIILLLLLSAASSSANAFARPLAATSPTLGAAFSYSVLAGSIVTNSGLSVISGDLGASPTIGVPPHVTGFPPGIVNAPGAIHDGDANAAAAQADNTAAFTTLDQVCTTTYAGTQDLTLVSPLGPGVYCADAFILTGNLTLNGAGVYIFKSASTLTTSAGSSVTGGDPCNVWWRLVSSASIIGSGSSIIGNVLALTDINLQDGASVNGRVMTQVGQVTLLNNNIFGPVCAVVPSTATSPTTVPEEGDTAVTVRALPNTGGAPIRDDSFPWTLAIFGSFSAIALILGVRAYLHANKQ
ncbi:ice-binding family protein [Candidatus Villigracilis saccharophilus]|uniref:ice-binding family protein n=1 Tax=Candidatus Villigracilis saccharophilus TaxID=3140684 RepID=UPI003137154F|nr:DUF3494 domain-containing protein [Anaerolineales bacterium]